MQPQRRLSDRILAAFNQACDQRELDIAELLLHALDLTLTREIRAHPDRRNEMEPLNEAYVRFKQLRDAADSLSQVLTVRVK
jgi:hypothetical protein